MFEKPDVEAKDHYGRLLAYVYVDGVNVNTEMVRQGWSLFMKDYGKGRLQNEFKEAEREAFLNLRGLWPSYKGSGTRSYIQRKSLYGTPFEK